MKSTTIQIKHVTRTPNAKSWQVRILRIGRQSTKIDLSHGFSDKKYGSYDQSLIAAMTWRDNMLRLLDQ